MKISLRDEYSMKMFTTIYSFILEHYGSVYIFVDGKAAQGTVFDELVTDGILILNVGPSACGGFSFNDDMLTLLISKRGVRLDFTVPKDAVLMFSDKHHNFKTRTYWESLSVDEMTDTKVSKSNKTEAKQRFTVIEGGLS